MANDLTTIFDAIRPLCTKHARKRLEPALIAELGTLIDDGVAAFAEEGRFRKPSKS